MRLFDYLAKKDESDEQFAKRAGISRATIKRIKKDGTARSFAVIAKIVAASNNEVTVADLVSVSRKKRKAA